jgi:Protein of unknown function (DUF4054)
MITFTQFVADIPEFANVATCTQNSFNRWQQFATLMLTPAWGQPAASGQPYTQYDFGMELIIAHYLALGAMNQIAAAAGGVPGLARGIISSEAAGAVNISYDTVSAAMEDAGQWNLTTYGQDFVLQARLIGAAPMQIGPHGNAGPLNGPAWVGPSPWPGYFG